jgi:glycerol-3-phosphate dehydrogenase
VQTKDLRLHGTSAWRPHGELETHLYQRYGAETSRLLELIEQNPALADVAITGQRYVNAEFVYAAQSEMATSLLDLLTRRTRAHLHDARASLSSASSIARLVATDLHWSEEECARQVESYRRLVHDEFGAAGLTL